MYIQYIIGELCNLTWYIINSTKKKVCINEPFIGVLWYTDVQKIILEKSWRAYIVCLFYF
jgi:hypothetical protein